MANSRTQSPHQAKRATADGVSESDVFIFEESAPRYSPPPKRNMSPFPKKGIVRDSTPKLSIMDKWSALGNRRRQYNRGPESLPETSRKMPNTGNWRTGFGLKVFSGNGGWDKGSRKENVDAKVRDWRRDTHAQTSRESLDEVEDVEWVGASNPPL